MQLIKDSRSLGRILALLLVMAQYEICAQNISLDTIDIRREERPFLDETNIPDYGYPREDWESIHEEMPWMVLRVNLHFLCPNGVDIVSKRIRDDVTKIFFRAKSIQPLYELCEDLVRNTSLRAMPNEYWFSKSASIIIVNDKVLNYIIDHEIGVGAGDGRRIYYYCYNLQTGNRITADDLFSEAAQLQVIEILKSRRDDDYERRDEGGRDWPRDIRHIDNFMMLPQELVFAYQPYEIGFGCDGGFKYTLKYSDFKHLLKTEALKYFQE